MKIPAKPAACPRLGAGALALALISVLPLRADAEGFEKPPTLPLAQAAPASLHRGTGFRVDENVRTDGLTTHFTIESDVGTFHAVGVETLKMRASEILAIAELERTSKTETFAKAIGSTALKPIESAAQMVASPVSTAKGLPGGINRFFGRVAAGTKKLAATATDSNADVAERSKEVAEQSGEVAATAFGYNVELRKLAKQLHVDPYTSNPVLAKKLEEIATVAFRGRVATNLVISLAVPVSMALTTTNIARDLVYDTPRGDLVAANVEQLKAMGVSEAGIQGLQEAPGFSLSLETALVHALGRLTKASGRPDVVALAAGAQTPDEAFFVGRAVRMLADHPGAASIERLEVRGTVLAYDSGGGLIVAAPADYVSWTERVSDFANRSDLAASTRSVLLSGRMTPAARQGFETIGWRVREGVGRSR